MIGTAPNRIRIVNYSLNSTNVTNAAFNIQMQIWLYEGSNQIEFRYGTGVTATSASIGIGGAVAANYQSVSTPANTVSTTTPNNTVTAWPGAGTIYTFSATSISGNFTVGASGTYPTLAAAFADLNCKVITGSGVTLNVLGGAYRDCYVRYSRL